MNLADIQAKIYFNTKSNATDFPNADMLRSINNYYEHVTGMIMEADDIWQFDDSNNTDLPIATTNLTANQQDYALATTHLTIDRVEVQDSGGYWWALNQINQQELKRGQLIALPQYLKGGGRPLEYEALGNSIFLYPIPNYSVANGLKVYFTRGPTLFTLSDLTTGTASPGFNSLFHNLIPLWVSWEYCTANATATNGLAAKADRYTKAIATLEDRLWRFYGNRDRDKRPRFTTSQLGLMGNTSGYLGNGASDSNR